MSGVQVITKQVDGHKYEPFEEAVVEVPEEHVGPVVDMLGQRKGQMVDMSGGAESGTLTRYLLSFLPLCCAYMSMSLCGGHVGVYLCHRSSRLPSNMS